MSTDAKGGTRRRNPVLWLVIGLPAVAVLASTASAVIAWRGGGELPERYHWEGQALERDDARSAIALRLGATADLSWDEAAGQCQLSLHVAGLPPQTLRLELTHATEAQLDREVRLERQADGLYRAPCSALPAGHWWLQLDDDAAGWTLRAQHRGPALGGHLSAG